MIAALTLAAALATPTPGPIAAPTPPPEPNHITIAGTASYVAGSGAGWTRWSGFSAQASALYEFQVSSHLRLSNQFHWERLSSQYNITFAGTMYTNQPFDYDELDDEFDVELGRAQLPTGVGIGYYDYSHVYSYVPYQLAGIGVGVDHWANWYVPTSFYYSVWYFPSMTSAAASAMSYGITRVDVGLNVRQSLVSPWGIRIGVQDETWFAKNANSENYNLLNPYVSVTWWK